VAEVLKTAFADRAYWLGDSDFVEVPRGLASKEYAAQLARKIRLDEAQSIIAHGTPPAADRDLFGKHTTQVSAADSEGNWVALTATINTSFGSKVVIPGTGVVLNNQMDDFVAQPGVTNFFGLVGASANAIGPGKRPLSSMSPTLVLRNGQPCLAIGGAGGPTIISQVLLTILRVADHEASPAEALRAPRLHHQWRPDEVVLEESWAPALRTDLERRGHRVRVVRSLGISQVVGVWKGEFTAAADPRGEGTGGVWSSTER
jgi:gamma-glutamyltranspeptidase/glutathione hydrolase